MIGRRVEMIHNEILIYIAYKEGLMPKSEYIEYLKSQLQTMIDYNITDKENRNDTNRCTDNGNDTDKGSRQS